MRPVNSRCTTSGPPPGQTAVGTMLLPTTVACDCAAACGCWFDSDCILPFAGSSCFEDTLLRKGLGVNDGGAALDMPAQPTPTPSSNLDVLEDASPTPAPLSTALEPLAGTPLSK